MNEQKNIQSIPLELACEIFLYIGYNEACQLRNECTLFRKAISTILLRDVRRLSSLIESKVSELRKEREQCPPAEEGTRLVSAIAVIYLHWIESEVRVLRFIVERYLSADEDFVGELPAKLGTAVKEITERIMSVKINSSYRHVQMSLNRFRSPLTLWKAFLQEFDSTIEPRCPVARILPFEVKVLDILCCSVAGNFEITLAKDRSGGGGGGGTYSVRGRFRVPGFSPMGRVSPDVGNRTPSQLAQSNVLKSLRDVISRSNHTYYSDIYSELCDLEYDLSSVFSSVERRRRALDVILQRYENAFRPRYPRVEERSTDGRGWYTRHADWDVPLNALWVDVKVGGLRGVAALPLALKFLGGVQLGSLVKEMEPAPSTIHPEKTFRMCLSYKESYSWKHTTVQVASRRSQGGSLTFHKRTVTEPRISTEALSEET